MNTVINIKCVDIYFYNQCLGFSSDSIKAVTYSLSMCVVFLASNHAEHIKVLTTALYAPLRLTERETLGRERDCVFHCPQCWSACLNSPQQLISHTV